MRQTPSGANGLRDFIDRAVEAILIGPQLESLSSQVVDCSLNELVAGTILRSKFPMSGVFQVRLDQEEVAREAFFSGSRDGDVPMERYGVGALWPSIEQEAGSDDAAENDQPVDFTVDDLSGVPVEKSADDGVNDGESAEEAEASRIARTGASTLGITSAVHQSVGNVRIEIQGAQYRKFTILGDGEQDVSALWVRFPFKKCEIVAIPDGIVAGSKILEIDGLVLEVGTLSRELAAGRRIITTFLANRTAKISSKETSERIAFQVTLSLEGLDSSGNPQDFLPVVVPDHLRMRDSELGTSMLFSDKEVFAVGHGIGVHWSSQPPNKINTTAIPTAELASVNAGFDPHRMPSLSAGSFAMNAFSQSHEYRQWSKTLDDLGNSYSGWIQKIRESLNSLQPYFHGPAQANIDSCEATLGRFRKGIALLRESEPIREAFCLANLSMANAGQHEGKEAVATRYWRPFQLFFIVMNLEGVVAPESEAREITDVIWLPTGGGKTEAYLGLASFSIWHQRISKRAAGTVVLMRYTLRLLTTQQLERASRLIIAMDAIRSELYPDQRPITIGIWIGSGQTPNRKAEAVKSFEALLDGRRPDTGFGLVACPRCKAPIGRESGANAKVHLIPGMRRNGRGSIELFCPRSSTPETAKRLPVLFVDDDIYESPPDFLLGTVDKIAVLAWNENARSIFGIGSDGRRVRPGPTLVIQDELHMIAGALGTAVSMYEPLIELLSTHDSIDGGKPKIICSSATIRDFQSQVLQLFGREVSTVFPPPGLVNSETFFTSNRNSLSLDNPGTRYRGVYAPGLRSNQTAAVRVYSALLCAMHIAHSAGLDVDPYATLVAFYNSLKDLGYAKTLITSDIPAHLHVMSRQGWLGASEAAEEIRDLELTSRVDGTEIPHVLQRLESSIHDENGVDVCLASTMIEVGLDVERLGTMLVLGQPKSRSTYIQVTGRVGRQWMNTPGLVYVVFSLGKARDLTHYEHFVDVHQKLYSEVTPTLLAPFIPPAIKRYLPATLAAFIRQTSDAQAVGSRSALVPDQYDVEAWVATYLLRASQHGRREEMAAAILELRSELMRRSGRQWLRDSSAPRSEHGPHPVLEDASIADAAQYQNRVWLVPTSLRSIEPLARFGQREHYR